MVFSFFAVGSNRCHFKRILTFKVSRALLGAILCRIGLRELADLGREGMTVGGVEEMVEIWKDGDWQ